MIPILHRANNSYIFLFNIFFFKEGTIRPAQEAQKMMDFLISAYPWVKALHVMSVIAWMAGLFYLPRLFVYHAERVGSGGETDTMFQTMELRLFRVIMNPAMIATWVFGLMLAFTPGIVEWGAVWPWSKAAAIVGMTWFHHWLGRRRKEFLAGPSPYTGRQFRMMNELPTLLMVVIVISIIVRPF